MLKELLGIRKNKPTDTQDLRFVDYEVYRTMFEMPARQAGKPNKHTIQRQNRGKLRFSRTDPLTIDFVFEEESSPPWNNQAVYETSPDTAIFVTRPGSAISSGTSLGFFSNSGFYSSFIKATLENCNVANRHVNHPDNFQPENYPFFDTISAWLIYLSEDCNTDFLNRFLERYYDKPTLFLCPNTDRNKTKRKIQSFVSSLNAMKSDHQSDYFC